MGARFKRQKKHKPQIGNCEQIEGERFHAHVDDVFRYNWWEVFCFPYILCSRCWECCMSICAGTNQCLIYWMIIQWVVCKITRFTTPDPILFPYYFYIFCQVILLTAAFVYVWHLIGKSIIIPYIVAYYKALKDVEVDNRPINRSSALSFRRYCFRKGDIFDTSLDQPNAARMFSQSYTMHFAAVAVEVLVYELFS